jgi:pteridine reductase
VQVNCVALGPVLAPDEYGQEEIARLVAGTLTRRMGSPEDVARAVLFFCEGTDFATGATLVLDGGRLLA